MWCRLVALWTLASRFEFVINDLGLKTKLKDFLKVNGTHMKAHFSVKVHLNLHLSATKVKSLIKQKVAAQSLLAMKSFARTGNLCWKAYQKCPG